MAKTVYMAHTFKLTEPKKNIKNYIKGINATSELADYLNYLTKREVPVKDIGIMLKNKCPFIVNYDFSKEALMNKRPIFHSVKELDEQDEMMLQVYLENFLDKKIEPLEAKSGPYDKEIIRNIKTAFSDVELTTTEISDEVLESDFELSVLWGAYASYLLTKGDANIEIEDIDTKKKTTLLKELEKKKIFSEEELEELRKNEGEWDEKYLNALIENENVTYEFTPIKRSSSPDHNEKFGYAFHTDKSCTTKFRLKNNGSLIGCMSDVMYTGDKPFSININIFFEHTLSDEYEGRFIINQSTTGWINSGEPIELDTDEKSSLYICTNENQESYVRLEAINDLVKSEIDGKRTYNVVSKLSNSDKAVFENLLGKTMDLESILANPRKYVTDRLNNNLPFIGIPIAAPLKSSVKDYAESGLSIKDRTICYDMIYKKLLEQGMNIEKEDYLTPVKTTGDIKASVESNSKYVQMDKAQYLNKNVDTYVIAYWGGENDFEEFKRFAENLKLAEKGKELVLINCGENEYEMKMAIGSLKIKLIHCNVGSMTELIRPLKGDSVTNEDIKLNALLTAEHIKGEFKRNGIDILKKPSNTIISNIVEIPAYHTNLREKKFDPCYSIRVAFAQLGLNIQVLNEVDNIESRKESRQERVDKFKATLAKKELELEDLELSTSVIEKENLKDHKGQIKTLKKEIKDTKDDLKKAIDNAEKYNTKDDENKFNILKSCLLDCFSKKGITAKLETTKLHDGSLVVFSFAIIEMAGESNIYLLTKYDKDGLFVKDISKSKSDSFVSEWTRVEDFPLIANRYINGGRNVKMEEVALWNRIETEMNSINAKENILLISASERKLLKDLTNSKITKGIRVLKDVENLTLVRINDFNDAPFGAVYGIEENNGETLLSPKNDQGLFKYDNNIYYSKSGRGATLQKPGTLTNTRFGENQSIKARRSIELCVVSNHLDNNDEVASLVSSLRRITIAYEVSTNKPYTLHIVEQLAKEFKK